jgi:hypothetical protein
MQPLDKNSLDLQLGNYNLCYRKLAIFSSTKRTIFVAGAKDFSNEYHQVFSTTKDSINPVTEEHTFRIPIKGGNRKDEIQNYLRSQFSDTGLNFECKALGLMGFIKFTAGYYAILIEDIDMVGKIMCHEIYEVRMCKLIKMFNSSSVKNKKRENRYYKDHIKKYLTNEKPSFFFSYTYDMTIKLQDNFLYSLKEKSNYKKFYHDNGMPIFQWNHFPRQNFVKATGI